MSNIDPTVPIYGEPTTQSVRDNFATAKSEIEALQADVVGAPFLPLAGGVMTGLLTLSGAPTAQLHATTKAYVDTAVAAGSGGTGGLPEAPSDNFTYGRVNATWAHVLPLSGGILSGALTVPQGVNYSGLTGMGSHAIAWGWSTATPNHLHPFVDGTDLGIGVTGDGSILCLRNPTAALEVATKGYVDTAGGALLPLAGGTLTAALGFNIVSILPPGTGALGTDGTRLQLYPRVVGTDPGIGIGVQSGAMFFAVRGTTDSILFYANTAQIAALAGSGTLALSNSLSVGGLAAIPANAAPAQVLALGGGEGLMLGGLASVTMGSNLYYSAGGMRYVGANPAAYFSVGDTGFTWSIAPAGSAGATVAAFTQLATLDNTNGLFISGPNAGVGWYDRAGGSFRALWYTQGGATYFGNTNTGGILQIGASGGLNLNAGSFAVGAGNITASGGITANAGNITALAGYGFVGTNLYLGQNASGGVYLYRSDNPAQYSQIYCAGGYLFFNWYTSTNAQMGYFLETGDFTIIGANAYKAGGGSWAAPSDSRLKTAVTAYDRGLDAIIALDPIVYSYNGLGETIDDGTRFVGLDAATVESIMPELIGRKMVKLQPTPRDDPAASPHEEPDTEILTLDPSALVYALVNAVRELNARLDVLETERRH